MPGRPDSPDVDRHYGFYKGKVVNVSDPEKRARIKATIPGLITPETAWAEPIGLPGSGSIGRPDLPHGLVFVPPLQAVVVIGFYQGDLDSPFYLAGPPQKTGDANPLQDVEPLDAEDQPNVMVTATANWQVVLDDREDATPQVSILRRGTNDGLRITIYDNGDSVTVLSGGSYLFLESRAAITIKAPNINLDGAVVQIREGGKRVL